MAQLSGTQNPQGRHLRRGVSSRHPEARLLCDGQVALWPRNSRAGTLHDPASIIEIDIPPILPLGLFERVQDKLALMYKEIEDGIVELDQGLKDRVAAL